MNYTKIYEVPSSLKELFEQGENSYRIIDYTPEMEMDNNQSMEFFLNHLGIMEESITEHYGTQVVVIHPEYSHKLVIDSGGLGDFFSHGFDVNIYIPEFKVGDKVKGKIIDGEVWKVTDETVHVREAVTAFGLTRYVYQKFHYHPTHHKQSWITELSHKN